MNTGKLTDRMMSVGEVAKRSDVNISTLHFYEEKGLIDAIRNAGNQRRYSRSVLRRIAVIKAAQKLGISLKEIKTSLDFLPTNKAPTQSDWKRLSQQWNQALDVKIRQLTALRNSMSSCIGCGCLSLKTCPLYNPDDQLGESESGAVLLNRLVSELSE